MNNNNEQRKHVFASAMQTYAKALPNAAPDFSDSGVISIWFQALGMHPFDELRSAIERLLTQELFFPTIAKIKQALGYASLDPEKEAKLIADRIDMAIRNSGRTNIERAKARIGEVGWNVVNSFGGWETICGMEARENAFAKHQWQTVAESMLRKQKEGILVLNPSKESSAHKLVSDLASKLSLTKSVDKEKDE